MLESPMYMGVSKNRGGPPQIIPFVHRVWNHDFQPSILGVEKKPIFLVQHPYLSPFHRVPSCFEKTQDLKQVELSDIPKGRLSLRCFYESVGVHAGWGRRATMLGVGCGGNDVG